MSRSILDAADQERSRRKDEGDTTMNELSIDVDMLEQLPAKTMLRLVERQQIFKRNMQCFQRTVREFSALFRWLEERDIDPSFDASYGSIDISFTGNGERMRSVWTELRRTGYRPTSRPEKGATSFAGFWDAPAPECARIFLNFSSSVCKRVQVGTKTVEQPIYETQCEELPGLEFSESPAPALIAPAPSEEILF